MVRDLLPVPGLAFWPRRASGGLLPPADDRRGALPRRQRHQVAGDARGLPALAARSMPSSPRWRDTGLVTELHERLRGSRPTRRGPQGIEPSAGGVDSQSVKADATVAHASRGF